MQKKLSFTTLFCLTLLAVTGCSTGITTQTPGSSKTTGGSNQILSLVAPVKKPLIVAPDNPDTTVNAIAQQYIKSLGVSKNHGVWMQTGDTLLANQQGTVPIPAASITKVATTLAVLDTFGPDRRFVTQVGATGPIEDGVLKGDLVIQGGEDPLFVWEEAIALGNTLNQMGLKQVTGNLVITGKFYMNFKTDPKAVGELLRIGLNNRIWTPAVVRQYKTLPPGTARPQIAIKGDVKVATIEPSNVTPILRHNSYPMAELLKKMNLYSNNEMAEMLANSVGGASVVAKKAADLAEVPENEIYLINGSGLTYENKISPRAATAMFRAIERYLGSKNMTIADVFTVIGSDTEGILATRPLPKLSVVKSGSLDTVSAIAGAIPTKDKGTIWFAIMNSSGDLKTFRTQQEAFLNNAVTKWGALPKAPSELSISPERKEKISSSEVIR